nr:PREDICTED: uncharacterized protein LOC102361573 [Latimeria chalumnae]|eukprot:XP_005988603.1 PREDICTED: uncharacterized protein LOC102361573 [Latimeria chalumnae]
MEVKLREKREISSLGQSLMHAAFDEPHTHATSVRTASQPKETGSGLYSQEALFETLKQAEDSSLPVDLTKVLSLDQKHSLSPTSVNEVSDKGSHQGSFKRQASSIGQGLPRNLSEKYSFGSQFSLKEEKMETTASKREIFSDDRNYGCTVEDLQKKPEASYTSQSNDQIFRPTSDEEMGTEANQEMACYYDNRKEVETDSEEDFTSKENDSHIDQELDLLSDMESESTQTQRNIPQEVSQKSDVQQEGEDELEF